MMRFISLLCVAGGLLACSSSSDGISIRLIDEKPGKNCARGGQRVEVEHDGKTVRTYACNGDAGEADVSFVEEPAGENCESGGQVLTSHIGDEDPVVTYLCNGNTPSVVATVEPAGKHCEQGGYRLANGNDVAYACHGLKGSRGEDARVVTAPPSDDCAQGGARIEIADGDPVLICNGLDSGATTTIQPATTCPHGGQDISIRNNPAVTACSGAPGATGPNGSDGTPGANGSNGDNGAQGEDGTDGANGDDAHGIQVIVVDALCPQDGISFTVADGTRFDVCSGTDGESVQATALVAGSSECSYGGAKLEVGDAPAAKICNGAPGTNGQSVTVTPASTAACPAGGLALRVSAISPLSYICNGSTGNRGANGESVLLTPLTAHDVDCSGNGYRIQVGTDTPHFVCNDSTSGAAGADGEPVTVTTEPPGANCNAGGVKLTNMAGAATYVCNEGLAWTAFGVDQQAVRNHGYVAEGATATTLTLPATATLALGDVVRLANRGTGSVSVALNTNQRYGYAPTALSLPGTSTARTPTNFKSVAISQDGVTLYAVIDGSARLSRSTNAGVTWNALPTSPSDTWSSVACSATCSTIIAARANGRLSVSTDSGANFSSRDSARAWTSVASSVDGTQLVAVARGGRIYTSVDSGVTWTARDSTRNWIAIASSADGSQLVAAVDAGFLYTSTDSGVTWTERESSRSWVSVASSADGNKLFAVADNAPLFVSYTAGVGWETKDSPRNWTSVTTSADGTRVVATTSNDGSRMSTHSGAEMFWSLLQETGGWKSTALSAVGTKLVQIPSTGQVLVSGNGNVVLGPNASIELTYTGSGTFFLSSFRGTLEAP